MPASSSSQLGDRKLWKNVWKLNVPQKVQIFICRVICQGLATKYNKWKRHLEIVSTCQVCGIDPETEHHGLVVCSHAKLLRRAMRENWELPDENMLRNGSGEWLLVLLDTLSVEEASRLALTWFVRNEIVHNSKMCPIAGSVGFLKNYEALVLSTRQSSEDRKGKGLGAPPGVQKQMSSRQSVRWVPPPSGWIKINVDGAFSAESGKAGVGVVLLTAWRVIFHASSAEKVEALACKEGVRLAGEWERRPAVLESDCATLIAALQNKKDSHSSLSFVLSEIIEACSSLPDVKIQAVWREQNCVADELA
ncbi:hypothetical protein EJB05_27394, partial [Eragrostis curvula]